MPDDTLVLHFAKIVLNTGRTAEEVCAARPDLLKLVRTLLASSRRLDSRLETLFPVAPPQISRESQELPRIPGYQIEGVLGRGGMGIVYRARQIGLARHVALKMLLSGPYAATAELERFKREAAAMARLQHCNIVQVFDFGDVEGRPFLAMELLESKTLASKLANVPVPAHESATLILKLANAVQAAHEAGIVHRDLKPANILLTNDGEPKIADFGLASRHIDGESLLTLPGDRLGTPSYMAPEQALGRLDQIGPAADIYSLGAILYETLTGRPPFRSETAAETIRQAIEEEPVSPLRLNSRVPRDLETIALRCLRKDPERRFISARELAADLGRFLAGEPILARPIGRLELFGLWVQRHRGLAAALAGMGILTLTLLLVSGFAAEYFRRVEHEQRALALEKGTLADENEQLARRYALESEHAAQAERQETVLRKLAEQRGEKLRRSLYLSEMNLCSQALPMPGAMGRINEWLSHWPKSEPDLRDWEWYYLYGLCHRDLLTINGPAGVWDVDWSPDGKRLAAAGADHTVRVWDASGRELACLRGHEREVHAVAWHPNGERLASASWDGTVKVWNIVTLQLMTTFRRNNAEVQVVAWDPSGARLASGATDGMISLWDADTGELIRELAGHSKAVFTVAWHPHAERLASGGEDGSVRIWDFTTDKPESIQTAGHTNWVRHVSWRPDGKRLASAAHDQVCKIWDAGNGEERHTLRGHTQALSAVDWSPDGSRLVTSSEDQTIRIWNAEKEAASVCLRGHTKPLTAVAWSPHGERLASASLDGGVKIWDSEAVPENISLPALDGGVNALAWSPDARQFAVAGQDGIIRIWDSLSASTPRVLKGHHGAVHSIAWSPDGSKVLSAGKDHTVRIWQVKSGEQLRSLVAATDEVLAVAWCPNGTEFASAGKDRAIHLWNAETGDESRALLGHNHWVYAIAWNATGQELASASGDGILRLWNTDTGEERLAVKEFGAELKCLAWSADGSRLATGGNDQSIAIYDAATGDRLQMLRGHTHVVSGLAWNPAGTRLVSVSSDCTAKIWDTDSGQVTLTLGTYKDHAQSVAWTNNGKSVAVGCRDGATMVYDSALGHVAGGVEER